jgi:uncharacterized protein YegP (UPF0339 family)
VEFQIVRTTDPRFPFFWRVVNGDGQMLTYSSARYRSKGECLDAVRELQREAAHAHISDLSDGQPEPV